LGSLELVVAGGLALGLIVVEGTAKMENCRKRIAVRTGAALALMVIISLIIAATKPARH
jgi:hypothetical protein